MEVVVLEEDMRAIARAVITKNIETAETLKQLTGKEQILLREKENSEILQVSLGHL